MQLELQGVERSIEKKKKIGFEGQKQKQEERKKNNEVEVRGKEELTDNRIL